MCTPGQLRLLAKSVQRSISVWGRVTSTIVAVPAPFIVHARRSAHLALTSRQPDVHAGNRRQLLRLSDSSDDDAPEQIDEIVLPEGITDVRFRGRALS